MIGAVKPLLLQSLLTPLEGHIVKGPENPLITRVVRELRSLSSHGLFFNLSKQNSLRVNHDFCVIVTENIPKIVGLTSEVTIVKVKNIRKAFWNFVHYYRKLFDLPVIGVTGTCGKSTTKDMIRHLLLPEFKKVVATYKSRNGLHMNLPYLMKIDDHTRGAVIEMGIASPGDLLVTCRYFQPQIGIITTIGIDHLDHFKNQDNYIREKGTFIKGLGYKGTLIINGDNEHIKKIDMSKFKGEIITFGLGSGVDYRATNVKFGEGGMNFTLQYHGTDIPIFVPGYGEHNVYNGLAALAAVHSLGLDLRKAGKSLESFRHIERHLQFHDGIKGCQLIDDTWSSNPTSMEAALNVLEEVSRGKKSIVVLGRMALLGQSSGKFYTQVARMLVEKRIHRLIILGNKAREIGEKAIAAGMERGKVHFCIHAKAVYKVLEPLVDRNTVVLFKNSMIDSTGGIIQKMKRKH